MRRERYEFPLEDFISRDEFNRIKKFSRDKETPFLIVDLQRIEQSYEELVEHMPFAKIHYQKGKGHSVRIRKGGEALCYRF